MPKRTHSQALTVPITDYQHPALAALEENELKYALRHDDPQTAILCLGGEHGNFTLSLVHVQEDDLIFIQSTYPIKACPPARAETLRLLNHLNNAMPGPAFRLDPDDGEIVFRHCVHLGTDAKLDPQCFMDALALCRFALDRSIPLIPAVALGQSTYAATLASRAHSQSDN